MSELKLEFVGKKVKDMYGTVMGRVVGIITDTDGSIESISVDCGPAGLKQISYEQLLVQGEFVIYIPRWRLDAQKLFRQKNLTLKRIQALQAIVSEDDSMKEDAEIVYLKYEKKLTELEEKGNLILKQLETRLSELDLEVKNIKTVLFDSKLQFRSNEITEDAYQQINTHTKELMEHINLEKEEIYNIKVRLEQQNAGISPLPKSSSSYTTQQQQQQQQLSSTNTSSADYSNNTSNENNNTTTTVSNRDNIPLESDRSNDESDTEAENEDIEEPQPISATATPSNSETNIENEESSWLNQVISK